jgi:hypothetical protein
MLIQETFDTVTFRDVCDAIFGSGTKEESMAVIEHYSKFWMSIIGTRGATGKKTVNAGTMFNNLFDVSEQEEVVVEETLDEAKLDKLELEEV